MRNVGAAQADPMRDKNRSATLFALGAIALWALLAVLGARAA